MRYLFAPFLLVSVLCRAEAGPFSLADPLQLDLGGSVHIRFQAFIADDPVSVHDLLNRWQGPIHPKEGTNLAIDDARTDIGFSMQKGGYFGYTYRHQSFIRTNRDTALLAWQQLNDIDFMPGKRYDLQLAIDGFEADGLLYAKAFEPVETPYGSLHVGIGFELLRGRNMQEGSLEGSAVANSQTDYDFSAVADYRYSENYLYTLDVKKPEGYGFSSHLSLQWRSERYSLHLLCNDLVGEIRWRELPYSYVNVNSSNKSYDENGFIIYNPTVSGKEISIDHTQRLYRKWRTEGTFKVDSDMDITAGADWVQGYTFPYGGISYRFASGLQTALSYESRFESLALKITYGGLYLSFRSDDMKHPSILGANLSYRYRF